MTTYLAKCSGVDTHPQPIPESVAAVCCVCVCVLGVRVVDGMLLFAVFVLVATPVIVITGRGELQLDNMKLIFMKMKAYFQQK